MKTPVEASSGSPQFAQQRAPRRSIDGLGLDRDIALSQYVFYEISRGIMAEILVRLLAGNDEERSFFLSQELSSEIARLPGVSSHAAPSASADPGKRGDPITLGAIVIAAVSGGGALTALVGTIGSYLGRDRRTEVEIQTRDGRKVHISSQMFKQKEMEELLRQSLAMTGE